MLRTSPAAIQIVGKPRGRDRVDTSSAGGASGMSLAMIADASLATLAATYLRVGSIYKSESASLYVDC